MSAVPEVVFTLPDGAVLKKRAERITIGKRPECDVRLSGIYGISPTHAVLTWRDGKLWVEDEMTAGGTRVNGLAVEPRQALEVTSGSRLEFGECVVGIAF